MKTAQKVDTTPDMSGQVSSYLQERRLMKYIKLTAKNEAQKGKFESRILYASSALLNKFCNRLNENPKIELENLLKESPKQIK